MKLRLYGPRLKLMVSPDRSVFSLLLDEFDEEKQESKIVVIEVPRGQMQEWVRAFEGALIAGVQ